MEMYKIETYTPCHISQLKKEWKVLDKGGDMTYFQTYEWNLMLSGFVPKDNWFRESRIFVVRKADKCVLIAPVLIIKRSYFLNKKGAYFMAQNDWSDYVNFIYADFDSLSVDFLFDNIRQKYSISDFYLENLRQDSMLYQYVKHSLQVKVDNLEKCVRLRIPGTEEEYMKTLSKGSRQNIRTAYNRMARDGVKYSVRFDDHNYDVDRCLFIRGQRSQKKRQDKGYSMIQEMKLKLVYSSLLYKLHEYIPIKQDKNSHVISFYEGDIIRAFFNYGIDETHKTIVLMVAGTDMEFSRYSPGIILMFEFIKILIADGKIKYLDFTRGTERYKYDLGGVEHYIRRINFSI